jgi:hypothetical protein
VGVGRVLVIAVVIAVAAAAPAARAARAAPAAARASACASRPGHTEVQSRLVRVYSVEGRFLACYGRRGRPLPLGAIKTRSSGSSSEEGLTAAAGRFAAFAHVRCTRGSCRFLIVIVDVGRRTLVQRASRDGDPRELVLSKKGLAGLRVRAGTSAKYVLKLDGAGAVVLDSGQGIGPVRLRGERLRWLHGSERRSAPLLRRRDCGPRHGDALSTYARSASMRVYSVSSGFGDYYYACLYSGGKPMFLGEASIGEGGNPGNDITQFSLAGRYLAFVDVANPGFDADAGFTFKVVDVRRHRVVHQYEDRGYNGNTVVTFGGQAGLLVTEPVRRVLAFDSGGRTELDSGDGVHGLGLRGPDTLTWLHGDTPMSYRMR